MPATKTTKQTAGFFLIAAVSALNPASAFTTSFSSPSIAAPTTTTALHLKSGQGNQLVAAYNAAAAATEHETIEKVATVVEKPKSKRKEEAPANPEARSFAARLFSLDFHTHKDDKEDVVYYPLVGFKLVHHEGRVIPLPTKDHTSCRLVSSTRAAQEEVYGWFSPTCTLDLYAEDICHEPTAAAEETKAEVDSSSS
eukprot:CAMPEP_0113638738 /NCGR_PEP_ID=MMETSP0017_2-20120614/20306_1 /TAXON_ID=2856 /ORGANISM="Cylindrotheca closterium" /LENGTH=196 /DNA_ID=CAMNT_0000549885 /DNA_START=190 /DNA_END=780 /DNA_ORIENTATION=+ /assembly_acc=CAM_ASM_000147